MTGDRNSKGGFAQELALALAPVGEAGVAAANGDPSKLETLLDESGLDRTTLGDAYAQVEARIQRLGQAWGTIDRLLVQPAQNDEFPDPGDFDEIFGALGTVFDVLTSLDEIQVADPDVDRIGELLLDYLLIEYLSAHHTVVYGVCSLFGVIEIKGPGTVGSIDLSAFEQVFTDPNAAIQDGFEWGTVDFEPYLVLFYVKGIVGGYGIDATFEPVTQDIKHDAQGLDPNETWPGVSESDDSAERQDGEGIDPTTEPEDLADEMLVVDILTFGNASAGGNLGVNLVPVPPQNGTLPGFALVPFGNLYGEVSEDLGSGWTFNADVSAQADWVFRALPERSGGLHTDRGKDAQDTEFHGEATVEYDASANPDAKTGIGTGDGTGVGLRYVQARVAIHATEDKTRVVVEAPLKGAFKVSPDDGFLGTVMPEGIEYDFDTTLGWSAGEGLYFERGGTLEASIPMNTSLGPLSLSELFVEMGSASGVGGGSGQQSGGGGQRTGGSSDGGGISLVAATSASLSLGPIDASVRRLGIDANITFPENGGPPTIDPSFEPPSGIGLTIDQGAVSGGGYLEWDEDIGRYAGSVTVKAQEFTINAVGILTTELPDGGDGFSLLIVLSGEFEPIPLGMGFTLNGVGGIIGINRALKGKPLRKAIVSGNAKGVLMPSSPVANAQRLMSDLGQFFPSRRASHVVGPMAEFGWLGELVTADVGIVLELPSGKINLLGIMSSYLPSKDFTILKLNMGVSGLLDIPNGRIAIDASIFDSRIAMFTLKGDMALRANWGDNPRFLLSVGGFHPKFTPPGDFPDLNRVTATLGNSGGNPRIELTGYFAVTSNTLQGGAELYAVAEAGPAKVSGHLGFDALIQYNPFKFVVSISASVSVTVYGHGLSLSLNGKLKGPAPFRVSGDLSIDVLFFSITVHVNLTVGEARSQGELPTAKILPELESELSNPRNWETKRPASGIRWATLRETDDDAQLMTHPFGRIGFRQTVVPLQYPVERFGNARPAKYTKFTIPGVSAPGANLSFGETNTEQFAPSQFTKMSKDEKLDSPAFESYPAGKRISHEGIYLGYPDGDATTRSDNHRTTTFGYECSVIDETKNNYGKPLSKFMSFDGKSAISRLQEGRGVELAAVGAVAHGPVRNLGQSRHEESEESKAAIHALAAGEETESRPASSAEDGAAADGGTEREVVRGGSSPDVGGLAQSVSMSERTYTLVHAEDMRRVVDAEVEPEMSKSRAMQARRRYDGAGEVRVVPTGRARDPEGEQ